MTLTGQVFPIMAGVATNEQVQQTFAAAKKYLQDRRLGGFRLNTDFAELQPDLGRAFSFAYGEKKRRFFQPYGRHVCQRAVWAWIRGRGL